MPAMIAIRPLSEDLPGPLLVTSEVRRDQRGHFLEAWNRRDFAAAGLDIDWVQDNISRSDAGVVRGMHWQLRAPQRKLVRVLAGAVLDGPGPLAEQAAEFAEAGMDLGIIYLPPPHTPKDLEPIAEAIAKVS